MTVRSSKVLHKAKYFSLVEEEILLPNNQTVVRSIVRHPGAVVIVPVQADGKLLLVKQFRIPLGFTLIEFPAGTLESTEPPLECAKREIQEEVQVAARSWTSLGTLIPAPGFCDELQHLFGAKDLIPSNGDLDEDEIIEVIAMSPSEIEAAIKTNNINDCKTIAAFVKARLYGFI